MITKAPVYTEKHIAFNNHIFVNSFCVLFGFVVASFGVMIDEKIFVVGGVLVVLVFIILLLISPTHYVFSHENVVICHSFKRKEKIAWKDIRSISRYGSWSNPSFMGLPHYKIYYRHEKEILFLNGEICKSKKTQRLLRKYYKGTVE